MIWLSFLPYLIWLSLHYPLPYWCTFRVWTVLLSTLLFRPSLLFCACSRLHDYAWIRFTDYSVVLFQAFELSPLFWVSILGGNLLKPSYFGSYETEYVRKESLDELAHSAGYLWIETPQDVVSICGEDLSFLHHGTTAQRLGELKTRTKHRRWSEENYQTTPIFLPKHSHSLQNCKCSLRDCDPFLLFETKVSCSALYKFDVGGRGREFW